MMFLRKTLRSNVVVVYLENSLLSWPAWRRMRADNPQKIKHIIDSISSMFDGSVNIHLNGHSGGGSFIFGYLQAVDKIPSQIKRITFLDSNYAYDSSYAPKILHWLRAGKKNHLDVFAYNDSVALLDGKPFVSATGGTWYRSHMMMKDLLSESIHTVSSTGINIYRNKKSNIHFFLKPNPDRKIYHTQQVELNGFIHSVLCGSKYDERGYRYYGERIYGDFIL